MHIPPSQWRRLSPDNQKRIIALIYFLLVLNTLALYVLTPAKYLLHSFRYVWGSDPRTFISSFTAIICFCLLLIMPLHPLASPATFGASLSASLMLYIFRF